ncbi:MAG: helix-turn-helix domain-containing protein [Muribaculaceae bacterium]|nr:helix-turn-helix domain-containing protein [Muribaculaceae bacterium]
MKHEILAVLPQTDIEEVKERLASIEQTLNDVSKHLGQKATTNELVDNATAAKMLNLSTRTLSTLRAKKVLKFSRVGRKIFYKVSEINELIERNEFN